MAQSDFKYDLEEVKRRGKERAIRKVEQREHLRLEIQSRKILELMHDVVFTLHVGYEESPNEPGHYIPLTRDRITGLKSSADVAAKLLAKVLPDLKQIEIDDKTKEDAGRILQDIELDNRMRLYIESKRKRGEHIHLVKDDGEPVKSNYDFLN